MCVVFSNFRAADLAIDGQTPFGLRALKVFLDYAENRVLHVPETDNVDPGSPFEDSIYDFLRSNGYEVRKQVGCARFRIDLGVVNSASPGRYLLGIECDGAKYHMSSVARDRDRLRQKILEKQGWKIHRIWSTDWYRNRHEVERNLVEVLERAKQSAQAGPVIPCDIPRKDALFDLPEDSNNVVRKPVGLCSDPEDDIGFPVLPYKVCDELPFRVRGELHSQSPQKLAEVVVEVVKVEGPIHFDELVRRIRSLWGLQRAGGRINEAVQKAVATAEYRKEIRCRRNFLWLAQKRSVPVRRRSEDPLPRIEFICDEEIGEAAKLVIKHQFSTAPEDLVVKTSRVLGIQATRNETSKRIRGIILKLVKKGELVEMPNGMLHFG
jgi:very-short-patch-repair endonuclease